MYEVGFIEQRIHLVPDSWGFTYWCTSSPQTLCEPSPLNRHFKSFEKKKPLRERNERGIFLKVRGIGMRNLGFSFKVRMVGMIKEKKGFRSCVFCQVCLSPFRKFVYFSSDSHLN